jgi:TonB family protein
MEAVVSDILRSRMQEPGGLTQTAAFSLAAHAVALLALAFVPGILPKSTPPPRNVMTISLGGTPGPKSGGMTMMGGRTIQAATPSVAPKIERVPMPSAAKVEPAMVMAIPDPKLKPKAPPKITATSKDPQGTNVGRGFETQKGSTTVETGVRGQGFGLSTNGGGGSGSTLDVKDFCCPEYLQDMISRIRANWVEQQQSVGVVVMKYTILRNGTITDAKIEEPSNIYALDAASQRAMALTPKVAPLPGAFPEDHLTVHLRFEYTRK